MRDSIELKPQTREDFHAIRKTGIGGSEVAAIVGLDPNRDKFSVYADKLGLIQRDAPNARMRWGKLLEQAIVEGYAAETGFQTAWCDQTRRNADRPWQLSTPDAFAWPAGSDMRHSLPSHGVDAKNVDFGRAHLWGDPGSDDVPTNIALQLQWYCSAENMSAWDAAPLFGGNNLRVYRIHRDRDIEAVLLDECDKFWRDHVLARVQPDIGFSQAAADYLKSKFPRNIEPLRVATDAEHILMMQLKTADEQWDEANRNCMALENAIKLAIGNAEGLLDGKNKVTYRRSKDILATDWEAVANDLIREVAERSVEPDRVPEIIAKIRREQIGKHCIVAKQGSRRMVKSWSRK